VIIIAAPFVPGGRTAATVTAGFLRYPPAAFVGSVLAGGVLWASYATALGYAGGRAFHANGWTALGAALLAALTVALLAGLARRLFGRSRQPLPDPVPVPAARRAA
jgi:membrane-associated protein